GGSHSGNVAAADLLKHGLLDILSSDYVPASPLQAAFLMASRGEQTLSQASQLLSTNPARAVGLDDRGVIEVEKRADLIRVHAYSGPLTPSAEPRGASVPIVRSVWREGQRVV